MIARARALRLLAAFALPASATRANRLALRKAWLVRVRLSYCTLLLACSAGGDPGPAEPAPVATITVSPTAVQLAVGEARSLTAELRSASGDVLTGRAVTWTTSDATVATVTSGTVTAVASGSATITASSEGKSAAVAVTVSSAAVATVTITPGAVQMTIGEQRTLVANLKSATGADLLGRVITWTSSTPAVATVANGFVTGVSGGTATITATSEGKSGTATVVVAGGGGGAVATVNVAAILPLDVGESKTLKATLLTSNFVELTGRAVSWSSENASIVAVTSAGSVTGVSPGTAKITATSEGVSGNTTVVVIAPSAPAEVTFASITLGANNTCALNAAGKAYCWGAGGAALGIGSALGTVRPTPQAVAGGLSFISIASGQFHTCAIATTGLAYCWGSNFWGELGNGSTSTAAAFVPTRIASSVVFKRVVSGRAHSCALTESGAAWCWGYNNVGQLGDGSTTHNPTPVQVAAGGVTFKSLSAGGVHTCGLDEAGKLYCWGSTQTLEGATTTGTYESPVPLATMKSLTFASISAHDPNQCAVTPSGQGYCAMFDPAFLGQRLFREIPGGFTFKSVTAGDFYFCGVTTADVGVCYGTNDNGRLGNGTESESSRDVVRVLGGLKFASISTGYYHACGLTVGGGAYCWGYNANGNLGDGTTDRRLTPVPVRSP